MVSLMNGSMVFCFTLAIILITTSPHRSIIPKTGGLSFPNVPRPSFPLRRRRRPLRPLVFTTSGCPVWPATTYASSHSTSCDSVTVGFFYDPFTQLGRHLLHITVIHRQFLCNLLIREIQSHEIQTQHPYFQRLMMPRKNGLGQIIKACVTDSPLIALTSQFRVIKAALDDLLGLTRGTLDAVWPAQLADGLITLHIIDQILDIDLHRWTPVMGWERGCDEFTPSSHPRQPPRLVRVEGQSETP